MFVEILAIALPIMLLGAGVLGCLAIREGERTHKATSHE